MVVRKRSPFSSTGRGRRLERQLTPFASGQKEASALVLHRAALQNACRAGLVLKPIATRPQETASNY